MPVWVLAVAASAHGAKGARRRLRCGSERAMGDLFSDEMGQNPIVGASPAGVSAGGGGGMGEAAPPQFHGAGLARAGFRKRARVFE